MAHAAAATYAHYADTDDSDAERHKDVGSTLQQLASCDPSAPPTVHALDRQLMKATEHQRFRIDWVLVDELAIGPAPRAPRHLERLADAGIKAVFSLCGEEEAPPPQDLSTRFAHERLVLPDHRSGRLPQAVKCRQPCNCF